MTASKIDLFLPIFYRHSCNKTNAVYLAKAVFYQTHAKKMAGRPEENLEKCAGGGNVTDMERPFHVSSL
jgi:hypothetical protein